MSKNVIDVVIIGGGPAGLSAAIYAERALLNCELLEQEALGGQMILTSEIDNYPAMANSDGFSITEAMKAQAEALGAVIKMEQVSSVEKKSDGMFSVQTSEREIITKAVIMAGGATPRKAGFEGEERLSGHGVSYCATCDGMFYRGKHVFVIGGGNSAGEEGLFLTRFADKVVMVVRKDHLRAQASVIKELEENDKVEIRYLTSVVGVDGKAALSSITFKNNQTGDIYTENYDEGSCGLFVFVGRDPASQLVKDLVDTDEAGYVIANEDMSTKTEGLFVAGDVRQKSLRQIVTAAADGAIAATSVSAYLGHPVAG